MSSHGHHPSTTIPSSTSNSMNILSAILRAPYPQQSKPGVRQMETVLHTTNAPGSERGCSPIRIITSGFPQGRELSPKGSSISPSRVPTTLPPKKSLSPSRTLYTTVERHSPSPRSNAQSVNQNVSLTQTQGSPASRSSQLLSHLPYLAQTLQQQGGVTPDKLFQQYKTNPSGMQSQSHKAAKESLSTHVGGLRSAVSPKPAHQSPAVHVTHVSTIRRTPSPAHMHPGHEVKPRVKVEHSINNPEAVNLIKTSPPPPSLKPTMQSQWSDTDIKFGDLLNTINRQQETVILPHLQHGLSPITPADAPPSHHHPWIPAASSRPNTDTRQIITHTGNQLSSSSIAVKGAVSSTVAHTGIGTLSSHAGIGGISQLVSSSFVPVSCSGINLSSVQSVGFQPVVLPSHHIQKPTSPKGQRQSPKSSLYGSSQHSNTFTSPPKQTTLSYIQSSGAKPIIEDAVKVHSIKKESSKYTISTSLPSVTESGPPNITISSCSNILAIHEKTLASHKLPRNPFTFPATPPASVLANDKPHFSVDGSSNQSKWLEDERKISHKERHCSDEMPCLDPVSPVFRDKKPFVKEENDADLKPLAQPYNMRFHTLANFPNNSTYRPSYRAISVAIQKAKVGCITSPAKSLDILRQNLQKSMNMEISAVIKTYMDKFFRPGIDNIRLNNGESSVTEDHIQALCRQILEEAKKMYMPDLGRSSVSPAGDQSDNVSEAGSSGRRSALGRRRHPSDTDSEAGYRYNVVKKKKGPYKPIATGRSTPSKLTQSKREGPKFDPERLTEETLFVMGSRANKAMGFGATRGRLYMKHPDLFKYSGDQDDKTFLYEHQHMPATGGKSYIIVLQDIKELLETDEYKDAPGINIDSLVGFTVPMWMVEKMRTQMVAMRTDLPKQAKYRSRSATPNEVASLPDQETEESPPKDLPFSSFQSPPRNQQNTMEASPADELDFLSTGDPDNPSPFTMTGGFDDATSQSDLDTLDDETSIEPAFSIVK